jgi:predicted DNA-binding transcriptional regulator YafY
LQGPGKNLPRLSVARSTPGEPSMRLDRLLSITIMLINRRKVTAPDLSLHFGVSIRTIYRDIEAICSAGIPIVSCQGYEGGFCIMENYRITRQMLTYQEILSIITALKGINTTLKNRVLDDAIEKIGCMIPEEKEEDFKTHCEQIAFDIAPWGINKRQQEYFKLLHLGISEQKLISFTYTNNNSATTTRTIEPMTLVFKSYSWYLFGYCRTRKDFRIFKLSRMRDCLLLTERFLRKQKSFKEVLEPKTPEKEPLDFELHFSPHVKIRVEDFFEPQQIKVNRDNTLTVKFSSAEEEWIYSWLLSFGHEVELIKPKHIRDRLLETIKKIQKKYRT